MRRLITILLFTLSFVSFGQTKLNGTYCTHPENCLTFKFDSLFEYSSWICTRGEKGNGIFKIKNDKLSLDFTDEDSLKNYFKVNNSNCNMVDSITLNFIVLDMTTNNNIPFPSILFTNSQNDTIKTSGNFEGMAKIKVKKSTLKSEINISYMGTSFSFRLNTESCQDINVYLTPYYDQVKAGTKWEYLLIKLDETSLTLRENERDLLFTKVQK